jgi:hypothetical protein
MTCWLQYFVQCEMDDRLQYSTPVHKLILVCDALGLAQYQYLVKYQTRAEVVVFVEYMSLLLILDMKVILTVDTNVYNRRC